MVCVCVYIEGIGQESGEGETIVRRREREDLHDYMGEEIERIMRVKTLKSKGTEEEEKKTEVKEEEREKEDIRSKCSASE